MSDLLKRVTALRLALAAKGYLPVPVQGKRALLEDWRQVCRKFSKAAVEQWATLLPGCPSTGFLCGELVGVDIDVPLPEAVAAIENEIYLTLGLTPLRRVGNAPKVMLCYRTDAPFTKVSTGNYYLPGPTSDTPLKQRTKLCVEFLGDGQQFVAQGVHPDTGRSYRWTRERPDAVGLKDLPTLTQEDVLALRDRLRGFLIAAGGELPPRPAFKRGTPLDLDVAPTDARLALVAEALGWVDNSERTYDGWIKIGLSLYSETGEAGRAIWHAFSARSPLYEPEFTDSRWSTFAGVRDVTIKTIWAEAEEAGWTGRPDRGVALAATDFAVLEAHVTENLAEPGAKSAVPRDWIEQYAYVRAIHRYVDVESLEMLPEAVFNRLYSCYGHPASSKGCAAMLWQRHPGAVERKLRSLTYRPGAGRIVVEEDGPALNTWKPSPLLVRRGASAEELAPWLDHLAFIVPAPVERAVLLNWMAWQVQHPEQKPNWAVLIGSPLEGVGKDMLMRPLVAALGHHNCRTVSQADLDSVYSGWAAQTRLVVAEEVRDFSTKTMNKLKAYITVPPEWVSVNIKMVAQYEVPNQAAFLAFTNFDNALKLQRGDRRWFVIWSEVEPRSADYYKNLSGWLDGRCGDVVGYLTDLDLTGFQAMGRAPMTEAKEAMRQASQDTAETWIEHAIEDGLYPFDADLIAVEDALGRLPPHVKFIGITDKKILTVFRAMGAKRLSKVRLGKVLGQTGTDRPHVWSIRRHEMYVNLGNAKWAELFWKQHDNLKTGDFSDIGVL